MTWLRRSRLRNNRNSLACSDGNVVKPFKLAKNISNGTTRRNPPLSSNRSRSISLSKPDSANHEGRKGLFGFLKRKDREHLQTNKPANANANSKPLSPSPYGALLDEVTVDGTVETSDITRATESDAYSASASSVREDQVYYMNMSPSFTDASSVSGGDDGSDAGLLFKMEQQNKALSQAKVVNPMLLGSVISPRQESEMSTMTETSRRSSLSSVQSTSSPARNTSLRSIKSRSPSANIRPGSSDSDSSVSSGDKSDTLRELFSLRGELSAIPDNSYHSTLTASNHGIGTSNHGGSNHGINSSRHSGGGNLDRIRERLERRTAPIEQDYHIFPPPLSSPSSARTSPKMRSFLDPFPQEQLPFPAQEKMMESSSPPPSSLEMASGDAPVVSPVDLPVLDALPRPVTPPPAQADTETDTFGDFQSYHPGAVAPMDDNTTTPQEDANPIEIALPPSPSSSPIPSTTTRPTPKMRSFLEPVAQEELPFSAYTQGTPLVQGGPPPHNTYQNQPRAVTPPTTPPSSQTASADESFSQFDNNIFNIVPMESQKDLSLEDVLSLTHLPADLSMDMESILPPTMDIPILPTESNDSIGRSMEDMLADLPDDEANVHTLGQLSKHSSRPSTVNSNCLTLNSGSVSEDIGHAIRKGMLEGMMFGDDGDTNTSCSDRMECDDRSESSAERSSVDRRVSFRREMGGMPSDVMVDGTKSVVSDESSYHFDNLPSDIESCSMSVSRHEDDSNSEVATVCSDEDITHLEELYSDIFGNEDGDRMGIPRVRSEESDLSSETLSMLGLLKDDQSCQSSVVSFDSSDFLEDDADPAIRSKASCSISMHDITTIHEENEDDVVAEEGELDHAYYPNPLLNGELHLRRRDLISPGTTCSGTFSSVTDDSYVGCMSFDSLSQGSSPRQVRKRCKVDMSHHQDFQDLFGPSSSLAQPFNDESSQFTFESTRDSIADCSYDSFSSESVKYMVDILKEEAERRRNKIKERIASIRESTARVSHTSQFISSRLMSGEESSECSL